MLRAKRTKMAEEFGMNHGSMDGPTIKPDKPQIREKNGNVSDDGQYEENQESKLPISKPTIIPQRADEMRHTMKKPPKVSGKFPSAFVSDAGPRHKKSGTSFFVHHYRQAHEKAPSMPGKDQYSQSSNNSSHNNSRTEANAQAKPRMKQIKVTAGVLNGGLSGPGSSGSHGVEDLDHLVEKQEYKKVKQLLSPLKDNIVHVQKRAVLSTHLDGSPAVCLRR